MMWQRLFYYVVILCLVSSQAFGSKQKGQFRQKVLSGRSVQLDLSFPYYQNRSAQSIASEVALNGFDSVSLVVCDDRKVSKSIVEAFHEWGLGITANFYGMCLYSPEEILPENWKDWDVKYTIPERLADYKVKLSPIHPEYRKWFTKRVVGIVRDCGFDGFGFIELFYSVYDVPEETTEGEPVFFGDVSEVFQQSFIRDTGNDFFPDFIDPSSKHYFKKNPQVYQDLIKYRVEVLADFADEVVNGPSGIRKSCPGVAVLTWTTGLAGKDGLRHMIISDGQDAEAIVKKVRPDLHIIQTNAPDWLRPDLMPDYTSEYKGFFTAIKKGNSSTRIGFQADLGSRAEMRKSPQWYQRFLEKSAGNKIDMTTFYEFHLRWGVYHNIPQAKLLTVHGNELRVYFDKRIDPACSNNLIGRLVVDNDHNRYKITNASVDGNIIKLTVDRVVPAGKLIGIPLGGVSDYIKVRLPLTTASDNTDEEEITRRASLPEEQVYGLRNVIPENEYVFLESVSKIKG